MHNCAKVCMFGHTFVLFSVCHVKINEEDIRNLCTRFEQMLKMGENSYFEPDEIDIIADYYEQSMLFDAALTALSYGLSLFPGNEMLLLRQARCQVSSGLLDEAADTLKHITEQGIEYHFVTAELAIVNGNIDEAIQLFHRIIDMEGSSIEECIDILDICADIDRIDILETLSPHIDARHSDATPYWRELALIYDDKEEFDKAVALFNKILDINSFSANDWFSLAKVHARNWQYDNALEAVDFAIALNENCDEYYAFKGYCYLNNEQYDNALKQYLFYLNLTTNKDVAHELIAHAYDCMNLNEKAVEHLLQAISINDHNANLYCQLGVSYRIMGQDDKVIECMYKALALNDDDEDAHLLLSEMLFYKKEFEEAYTHLKRVDLSTIPGKSFYMTIWANTCMNLQRYDEAVDPLLQLIEKDPYSPYLYHDLILCYMRLEQYDELTLWLDRAEKAAVEAEKIDSIPENTREQWSIIRRRIDSLRDLLRDHFDGII